MTCSQTQSNPCESCLHNFECFEKRGRCREYKDLKGVIEDIEMLNQKAKSSARSKTDEADNRQGGAGDLSSPGSAGGETAGCAEGQT